MEEQPSPTMVNEGVTSGDIPAALAYVASSAGTAFPPASQDGPVDPVIQPQPSDQHQDASKQGQQLHNDQQQQQQLQAFWSGQLAEIEQMTTEFKTHSLPLSRVKKIMKADADVPRIAGEAPAFLTKACEMFIQELTQRAWLHTEEDKRRTVQKNDVTMAIARTDVFDFLVDIGPSDKPKGNGVGCHRCRRRRQPCSTMMIPMVTTAGMTTRPPGPLMSHPAPTCAM